MNRTDPLLQFGRLRSAAMLCLLTCSLLLGACASLPGEGQTRIDPWETYNRQIFEVNEVVDKVAVKPIAETYRAVLPKLVRTGDRKSTRLNSSHG